jgi:hypothetical protein
MWWFLERSQVVLLQSLLGQVLPSSPGVLNINPSTVVVFLNMPSTSSNSDAKDRQYAQLARNLKQLASVVQEGAELFNLLGVDLHAMALLSAHHGAQ